MIEVKETTVDVVSRKSLGLLAGDLAIKSLAIIDFRTTKSNCDGNSKTNDRKAFRRKITSSGANDARA